MRRVVVVTAVLVVTTFTVAGSSRADFWSSIGRIFSRTSSDSAAVPPGSASPGPGSVSPGMDSRTITSIMRAMQGFSEEEEIAIGREVSGRVLGAAPLAADTELQLYVNRVGRWVALQSERPDLPWRFGVIESNDINAFAAPGGAVLVTSGLYRMLHDESELAGVLAHEIAHIIAKHHLKLLQQGTLLDAGSRVLAARSGEREDLARWIGTGAELFARGLDRDAEYEADRMAVVLAARAGYDPFALPAVLEAIGHATTGDTRVSLLYRTHPLPSDRLTRLGDATGNRLDRIEGSTGRRLNSTTGIVSR